MLASPKNASFWRGYKLHMLVAVLVLMLHGLLVYALWRARGDSLPEAGPLSVRLVYEPVPATAPTPSSAKPAAAVGLPPDKAAPAFKSAATEIKVSALSPSLVETVTPASTGSHLATLSAPLEPAKAGVGVITDLSLACPVRIAPVYPWLARKQGETGKVLLRIELDETGRLVATDIARSSGFTRLDEAALAAVKSWRCQPAMRDGQALRVVSMESFEFNLGD